MTSKINILMLALILCLGTIVVAYGANDDIAEGMVNKAGNGIVNMFTGFLEFPVQIVKGYKNGFGPIENTAGSKTVGTVLGVFRGVSHAAGRTSWGVLELVGFWSANAEDNEGVGVPLDAKYAWEEGEQYSLFDPSLQEGIKPIGRKLVRGFADAFLGIAEVPGQIKQGVEEKQVVQGTCRGLWFWWSRQLYGSGQILTCIVPNPEENPGYAFNGEWPWSALAE